MYSFLKPSVHFLTPNDSLSFVGCMYICKYILLTSLFLVGVTITIQDQGSDHALSISDQLNTTRFCQTTSGCHEETKTVIHIVMLDSGRGKHRLERSKSKGS